MKIQYVGPHDAVEVPGLGVVERDGVVEAKGKLAQSLLDQSSNWTRTARDVEPDVDDQDVEPDGADDNEEETAS